MEIKTIHELVELLQPKTIEDIIREKILDDLIWDYDAKSSLRCRDRRVPYRDQITIMHIEKEYDCSIPDELGEYMFSMDPQLLMRSYIRNKRIEELGL